MLFRDHFDAALVRRLAARVHQLSSESRCTAWTPAEEAALVADLPSLTMKARVERIADALDAALDGASAEECCAFAVLCTEGPPPWSGFEVWPATLLIERHGPEAISAGLAALETLTQRFTGEFAIRPLLLRDPEPVFAQLTAWTQHPNEHVRRLVSEGTRTHLPWGMGIPALIADPQPIWPLLDALLDDPSDYVRRSVANALNDLSRDHPDRVLDHCRRWLADATPLRKRTLRRALRTRIKRGDVEALEMLGLGTVEVRVERFALSATRCAIGERLTWEAELLAEGTASGTAVVDVVVTYARPGDRTSTRVFKGAEVALAPGERRKVRRTLSLRDVSIRTHHPGPHAVTLQVNGRRAGHQAFEVLPAPPRQEDKASS